MEVVSPTVHHLLALLSQAGEVSIQDGRAYLAVASAGTHSGLGLAGGQVQNGCKTSSSSSKSGPGPMRVGVGGGEVKVQCLNFNLIDKEAKRSAVLKIMVAVEMKNLCR